MDLAYGALKLAEALLLPSSVVLILYLLGSALLLLGRATLARPILIGTTVILMLATVLPTDQWLLKPLEARFPTIVNPPPRVDGIIVLGGAVRARVSSDRGRPELNEHAERMTEAVALARRYPQASLVFSGGTAAVLPDGEPTETDVARRLFQALGIDLGRVVFEQHSRTTFENVVLSKDSVKPKPGETWLLVTSAAHMPRAVGVFRRTGWDVLPWPVDYMTGVQSRLSFPNVARSLTNLDLATHEWLGLFGYYLFGYSDALFPSPDSRPGTEPTKTIGGGGAPLAIGSSAGPQQ